MRTRVAGLAMIAAALPAAVAGCGAERSSFRNQARPATPIVVTAAVDEHRVRVSPRRFGAGPVTIIVSNQSGAARRLTFETDEIGGAAGGVRTTSRPVPDGDTTELQADPRPGTYRLAAGTRRIAAAGVTVGDPRPSAQDELLRP